VRAELDVDRDRSFGDGLVDLPYRLAAVGEVDRGDEEATGIVLHERHNVGFDAEPRKPASRPTTTPRSMLAASISLISRSQDFWTAAGEGSRPTEMVQQQYIKPSIRTEPRMAIVV